MKKKVNYQRTLSEALGNMKWDTKCFVVHHINHNRDDNNIYNLVLIPKNFTRNTTYLLVLHQVTAKKFSRKMEHVFPSHILTRFQDS